MVIAIILTLIVARLITELILNALNAQEVRRNAHAVPAALSSVMSKEDYTKAVDYTLAKGRFARIELVYDTTVLLIVLFSGFLPWVQQVTGAAGEVATWREALFVMTVAMVLSIPGLPLEWWSQFRLEERFGFNKSSLGLWITDKVKGLVLSIVLGFPLLWGLLAIVRKMGGTWWLWGFGMIFGFQLLMLVLYPKLILPLFNKLSPLPEGELKQRLLALGDRTGFRASRIEVMDGSKRSGHSNAFFTGFGRFRRIVLFDTLINQLSAEELEAVLAHEVGHYRRGHIPKMLVMAALMLLGGFGAIAWLTESPWFNPAFGFAPGDTPAALLLFGLLSGVITFWFTPLGNLLSRKHEYEADAFAKEAMGSPVPLIGALHKLAQKNLSNLTPHPYFSGFYYSHPTIVERERALLAPA